MFYFALSITIAPEFKPLTPSITPGLGSCGNTSNKIIGGSNAQANSWPWIVYLRFQDASMLGGNRYRYCGGTIVENSWVLTAAHCCQGNAKVLMSFGQHDLDNHLDAGEFTLTIEPDDFSSHVFIHESYTDHSDGSDKNFDVCLLKATVPDLFVIGYSHECGDGCINAACLPTKPAAHGDACWIAGWGKTSDGSRATILQEVGVNLFSDDYCNAHSHAFLRSIFRQI